MQWQQRFTDLQEREFRCQHPYMQLQRQVLFACEHSRPGTKKYAHGSPVNPPGLEQQNRSGNIDRIHAELAPVHLKINWLDTALHVLAVSTAPTYPWKSETTATLFLKKI